MTGPPGISLRWRAVPSLLSGAVGVAALARPEAMVSAVTARPASALETFAARAIGGRLAAQAVIVLLWPGRTAGVAAAVDVLHAATMVPAAAVSRRERRLCLASAVTSCAVASANAALWLRS